MSTISNNKLPEWRKALNSAVENYQSTQAWYEENPDNPSAEQDMDAAEGDIEKLLKQYGVLIVLSLMDEIDELQERRKAERGSEPVAWTDAEELSDLKRDGYAAMISLDRKDCEHADPRRQILLFTHPAPARQRDQIRREHAEWSDKTFGDVGPIGPLKHLSKEALEAAADPSDPLEWADMQFLLWDAQRRAGNTPVQSPIDHGYRPECECSGCKATARICAELAGSSTVIGIDPASGPDRTVEVHYVAPPGYVMVPKVPTDEMIAAAMECDDVTYNESDDTVFYVHHREIYKAMLAAAPQPEASDGK